MSDITHTKTRNKPTCVICNIPLHKLENEDYLWICPKDRAHRYQIYAEVMAYDNDFSSIYGVEEEAEIELAGLEGVGNPSLLSAEDEFKSEDNDTSKSDIAVPKYFRDSPTTKIIEYREE